MNTRYQKPDLRNRRDAAIIWHLVRNVLSFADIVHNLFFNELSTDTSRKVLSRLVKRQYLSRYPLWGNKHYFRLGPAAVSRWGYPRGRTEKLGSQRLPYEIGSLAYTCLDDTPRKRLLSHELTDRYPWFPNSLRQSWAYVFRGIDLGTIRVELGGRPNYIISKLAAQLYRYCQQMEFRELVEQQRFFLVVVTATEYQEAALQHEAVEQQLPVELQTAHYPDLARFV